MQNAIIASEV